MQYCTRRIVALMFFFALVVSPLSYAAVGNTPGQFAVSPTGAATYTIPIWTPPGVRGIEPRLALVYNSNISNGLLGPGWSLQGLSSIMRCAKTWAQDSAPAAVTLTMNDRFCMNGNRLRVTSGLGTYGQPNSVYQTEIADFSRITAKGTAGNGPAWFEVEGKDGLIYEYGNSNNSRVIAPGTSTAYAWNLNRVRDRNNNDMLIAYSQTTGSFAPSGILYAGAGGAYNYEVTFTYSTRVSNDHIIDYIAGSQITQTLQLESILVKSSNQSVRFYDLMYTSSPTTFRARLTSVQECGFNPSQDCKPATAIGYQDGPAGVPNPTASTGVASAKSTIPVDVDADGRSDLVYSLVSGSNRRWWIKLSTGNSFGSAIDTGVTTAETDPVLIDDFLGRGRADLLVPRNSGLPTLVSWIGW